MSVESVREGAKKEKKEKKKERERTMLKEGSIALI